MAAMIEYERDQMRERTLAGLAAARARGKQGGGTPVDPRKMALARKLYADESTARSRGEQGERARHEGRIGDRRKRGACKRRNMVGAPLSARICRIGTPQSDAGYARNQYGDACAFLTLQHDGILHAVVPARETLRRANHGSFGCRGDPNANLDAVKLRGVSVTSPLI